ncbi:hypothetical protein CAT49_00070 [Acinetobacter baumannii]|uniref:Putative membrane protein n=1 Tax=Acinetobacter baumannii 625974 TaxID=1310607 RepID=A0A009PDU4_ACIBA|nr:putative membrane protein [Acinetobacter baumannii 625974]OTR57652.1 hypothetical protein CAT49_00070 [Acinetobacter baumannii]
MNYLKLVFRRILLVSWILWLFGTFTAIFITLRDSYQDWGAVFGGSIFILLLIMIISFIFTGKIHPKYLLKQP